MLDFGLKNFVLLPFFNENEKPLRRRDKIQNRKKIRK